MPPSLLLNQPFPLPSGLGFTDPLRPNNVHSAFARPPIPAEGAADLRLEPGTQLVNVAGTKATSRRDRRWPRPPLLRRMLPIALELPLCIQPQLGDNARPVGTRGALAKRLDGLPQGLVVVAREE